MKNIWTSVETCNEFVMGLLWAMEIYEDLSEKMIQ